MHNNPILKTFQMYIFHWSSTLTRSH